MSKRSDDSIPLALLLHPRFWLRRNREQWKAERQANERAIAEMQERIALDDRIKADCIANGKAEIYWDHYGRLCVAFPPRPPWDDPDWVGMVVTWAMEQMPKRVDKGGRA